MVIIQFCRACFHINLKFSGFFLVITYIPASLSVLIFGYHSMVSLAMSYCKLSAYIDTSMPDVAANIVEVYKHSTVQASHVADVIIFKELINVNITYLSLIRLRTLSFGKLIVNVYSGIRTKIFNCGDFSGRVESPKE